MWAAKARIRRQIVDVPTTHAHTKAVYQGTSGKALLTRKDARSGHYRRLATYRKIVKEGLSLACLPALLIGPRRSEALAPDMPNDLDETTGRLERLPFFFVLGPGGCASILSESMHSVMPLPTRNSNTRR